MDPGGRGFENSTKEFVFDARGSKQPLKFVEQESNLVRPML